MTAPGSPPLTLIVVALVVAATGYAGGRLHQWWRTGKDRDAAYREGYDTATRSVFSLAARLIGPRRAPVRGCSVIVRSTVIDDGGTTVPMPPLTADATPPGRPPAVTGPPLPAADVPLTDDATWYAWGSAVEDASGYAARADDVRRPASRSPNGPAPIRSNPASHFITGRAPASGERDGDVVPLRPAVPDAVVERDGDVLPLRRPAAHGDLEGAGEGSRAVGPAALSMPEAGLDGAAPAGHRPSATVPSPRRSGSSARSAPTAAVWLPEQVPPDAGSPASTPAPDDQWWRHTETAGRGRRSRRAEAFGEEADDQPAPEGGGVDASAGSPESSGRHTVPDELVQAATYRLPPDRVFRAKVRHLAAEEQDSTTRLPEPPVPKPRASFPPD
jgi:hypothetical protein